MIGRFPRCALSALLLATPIACAHVEAPVGGPDDREPPRLAAVQPDSLQVVSAFARPVVFQFDERLSERGIDDRIVWVSPRTSGVRVEHRGSTLRVSLRSGWEPDRIYHVTVLPGITDLFGNRLAHSLTTVFSTGPAIPETRLVVSVVDRITGRPPVGARVEAITADSLVYALPTDSAGVADFRRVPEGEYVVRAFNDANRDRVLGDFEARDVGVARVSGTDTASVRLSMVLPDTTPPALATVRLAGQNLELRFDDHLDPDAGWTPGRVQVVGPDGTLLPVAAVGVGTLPAADTAAVVQPAPPVGDPPTDQPAQTPAAVAAPRRLPSQTLVVRPATPLEAGVEYTVRVQRVRNVVGLESDVEGTVRVPPAEPAAAPAATRP
jgi:hypothetical protein